MDWFSDASVVNALGFKIHFNQQADNRRGDDKQGQVGQNEEIAFHGEESGYGLEKRQIGSEWSGAVEDIGSESDKQKLEDGVKSFLSDYCFVFGMFPVLAVSRERESQNYY